MAKELPYFKFEPAEYLTKDISFCSLAAQGLFTNLCSYYWQRECKLTKDQFLRRINEPELFNELLSEGVIDLIENNIVIKFLDSQHEKATILSNINSLNGKKGGRPKSKKTEIKANQNRIKSELKGIREDKIRKDKIKEEENDDAELIETTEKIKQIEVLYYEFVQEIKKGYHHQWAEATYMRLKIKKGSLTKLIEEFKNQLIVDLKLHPNIQELKQHLNNWLNKQDSIGNLNSYKLQKTI